MAAPGLEMPSHGPASALIIRLSDAWALTPGRVCAVAPLDRKGFDCKNMSKRLYVGNLSWNVSDEDLREVFQRDGRQVVDARVITDRETGRSRGFGFVEFASPEEGQAAIDALDGQDLDGRPLRVNAAQERGGGGGGGGRGGHGGGGGGGRW